jgi:hypothetical protein
VGTTLLLSLGLFWYWSGDSQQEPFFWAEGVSIWPTELVRLFAAVMTMYFIVTTIRSLRQRKAEIVNKYVKDSNNLEDQFDFPKFWKKHDQETRGCKLISGVAVGIGLALALLWLIFDSELVSVVLIRSSGLNSVPLSLMQHVIGQSSHTSF